MIRDIIRLHLLQEIVCLLCMLIEQLYSITPDHCHAHSNVQYVLTNISDNQTSRSFFATNSDIVYNVVVYYSPTYPFVEKKTWTIKSTNVVYLYRNLNTPFCN